MPDEETAGDVMGGGTLQDLIVLTFGKERETKGTWKYEETTKGWIEDRLPVGSMYLTNAAIEKLGRPEKLEVIVRAVKS